jgi:uncharacterized coiled-coil protein SlyX
MNKPTKPNKVPPWMRHVTDEEAAAHNEECHDGALYGNSQNVVGVSGGSVAYAECPVCAQDPFHVLRTAMEARIEALEAQIATQTFSVRLQGQADALDWVLDEMDRTMRRIHNDFHFLRWHEHALLPSISGGSPLPPTFVNDGSVPLASNMFVPLHELVRFDVTTKLSRRLSSDPN